MKKIFKYIFAISAVAIGIICLFFSGKKEKVTRVKRPDFGENSATYSFSYDYGGISKDIDLEVDPIEIGDEDLCVEFESAYEQLCKTILGNNKALDKITTDLNFVNKIGKYGICVEYYLESYDVINGMGCLNLDGVSNEIQIDIEVFLSLNGLSRSYLIPIIVVPKEYTDEEYLQHTITKEINSKQNENTYVDLPQSVDGKKIEFYSKSGGNWSYIIIVVLLTLSVLYYRKIYLPKIKKEKREKELMSDYPEVVSKLSLLMGAGMSTILALSKIVADDNKKHHTVYEELNKCINKISSGISETIAYREFGKACGVIPYIRLGNLLSQNISKGTSNIFELLSEETRNAFIERKNMAKKLGEESGTKMLLPMGIQLIVVLIIVVFPSLFMFV